VSEVSRMPRLFTCAAQTQQALDQCLEKALQNPTDLAAQFLLSQQFTNVTAQSQYRAYTILNVEQKVQQQQSRQQIVENRPVFYLFNGTINTDLLANYEQLMKIQRFRESIEQACQVLTPYGLNLNKFFCQQQRQNQVNNTWSYFYLFYSLKKVNY